MELSITISEVGAVDAAARELLYTQLYAEFGVARDADWFHPEQGGVLALARDSEGSLLGVARLLPVEDEGAQLRQIATLPEVRRRGVGRALVRTLESRAACDGARYTWLNARESAYDFYLCLGYEFAGHTFISELTGVPHRRMRSRLG